jgi:hypothetical protein
VKCWINKGEIMPPGYTGTSLTVPLDDAAGRRFGGRVAMTAAARWP